MFPALSLVLVLFAADTPLTSSPIAGVPAPEQGALDPALTKLARERADVEMKTALAALAADSTIPEPRKREIREKVAKLKVAVFTTPKTLDETVKFYEGRLNQATFIFAERDLLTDLRDLALTSGLVLTPAIEAPAAGKRARSARWAKDDGSLEIDVEDHLIDPRDGKITKKTVVLVTSLN